MANARITSSDLPNAEIADMRGVRQGGEEKIGTTPPSGDNNSPKLESRKFFVMIYKTSMKLMRRVDSRHGGFSGHLCPSCGSNHIPIG